MNTSGKVVWRRKVLHDDRKKLRDELKTWPEKVPVILEATFGWGWICDELKAANLQPMLASSSKVAGWRKARGLAKSNRIDSDLLAELYNQQPPWWQVWLAPPQVREQRELLRYRASLVKTKAQTKNRIHAILHQHGIVHTFSDLFGVAGQNFLTQLLLNCDERLSSSAMITLKGYRQLLDQIRRQIAAITREFRSQLKQDSIGERLRTIPGIDVILAYTILAEVGRIERFDSAAKLASYSLLAPRAYDSGDENPDESPIGRHVGHLGRKMLKWAFIQAAHAAIRHGGRFREQYNKRSNNGKRDRNRACIAVAHTLCKLAYVCWRKDVDYTNDPPARPGSKDSSSRSGTGQLDSHMVAVV